MGYVTCGRCNHRCCWRCDECPKCSGKFEKLLKGDYCPDCTRAIKEAGGVWSEFRKDYVKRERQPTPLFDEQAEPETAAAQAGCLREYQGRRTLDE